MRRRPPRTVPAVLLSAAAALATLTGCVTVHGEREVIPAVAEDEAPQALKRFTDVYNRAYRGSDPTALEEAETGPLKAMNQADLTARKATAPQGDPAYVPLELTDARFIVPKSAGWPKWFLADTASNRDANRWLVAFVRSAPREPWRAAYLLLLSRDEMPAFALDAEGYATPVPVNSPAGLVAAPGSLSRSYADYLQRGEGELFAPGQVTTRERELRAQQARTPTYWTQYADQPAEPDRYPPLALRTTDGGALALFTTHHTQKQTMAEGQRVAVTDPAVRALLTGRAEKSLMLTRISEAAVKVPAAGAADRRIVFLNRLEGLTAAAGS
ncbi:hypothetical protein [Streptomyces sp. URMC 123]|uniref:hypothetical protein n=1 Tax=Streptomyces sp. URMC 123 TaxID=3423403 RepID=UPI003F1BF711